MEAKVFVFLYSFLILCLCSNVKMPKYPYQLNKEYSSTRVTFYLLSFFSYENYNSNVLLEHATVNVLIICTVLTVSGIRHESKQYSQ